MKYLLLSVFALSLSASVANAGLPGFQVPVEPSVPVLNDVSISITAQCVPTEGIVCPAVQPQSHITFSYVSCAEQSFSLETAELEVGETELVVVLDSIGDCKGPTHAREYTLQISSDASVGDSYILVNKVGVQPTFPSAVLTPVP